MLKINEIFYSIQGESTKVGWPTVFVRLSGCHLRCTYCDTTYAYYEGAHRELSEIISEIKKFPSAQHVCITGGEPLLQKGVYALCQSLCDSGFSVSMETSGDLPCSDIDPRVHLVIDVKTPDSGAAGRFHKTNLHLPDRSGEYKFVICSERDFEWSEAFCRENALSPNFNILYSPSFGEISPQWLAEKILTSNSKARLQLQLHKYIWSPHARGV